MNLVHQEWCQLVDVMLATVSRGIESVVSALNIVVGAHRHAVDTP